MPAHTNTRIAFSVAWGLLQSFTAPRVKMLTRASMPHAGVRASANLNGSAKPSAWWKRAKGYHAPAAAQRAQSSMVGQPINPQMSAPGAQGETLTLSIDHAEVHAGPAMNPQMSAPARRKHTGSRTAAATRTHVPAISLNGQDGAANCFVATRSQKAGSRRALKRLCHVSNID